MRVRAALSVGLVIGLLGPSSSIIAQEGTWTLTASAGIALLQFDAVDEDGRRDIAAINALGIPIGDFPALRCAPLVEISGKYRYERDMAVAPFASYQQARTNVALHDSARFLSLDRRLTSVVGGVDVLYYFPPITGGSEISVSVGVANLWATADQITTETETVKAGPLTEERVLQDAYAIYRKSKLIVRASFRADVPFSERVSLTAIAHYQHAPMGTMSGTLREFSLERAHDTTIEFNYSAVQLMLGCQIIIF
ncbi:MAG: hypothetical protein MUE68_13230 [Bacteroidetes bacterium]|jgi:hypothetical protein|nr:hypothetical protein [Bacteroidota bacterium]